MRSNELLRSRLKNCITTILDLEPILGGFEMGNDFLAEFVRLKSFMQRLDNIFGEGQETIDEGDVARIEVATAIFLEELKAPIAGLHLQAGQHKHLQ